MVEAPRKAGDMTLYLPVGPPGCGKTHLATAMIRQNLLAADAWVSTDNLRRVMTGTPIDQSANDAVWSVARTITHERLKHGLTVYFDATNLKPEYYDKMLALAHEKDHRVLFILHDTDYQLCRTRNIARGAVQIPDTAVERMIALHRGITEDLLRDQGDVITGSDTPVLIEGIKTWMAS